MSYTPMVSPIGREASFLPLSLAGMSEDYCLSLLGRVFTEKFIGDAGLSQLGEVPSPATASILLFNASDSCGLHCCIVKARQAHLLTVVLDIVR